MKAHEIHAHLDGCIDCKKLDAQLDAALKERDSLAAQNGVLREAATRLMRELSNAAMTPEDPLLEPPPEFLDPIRVEQPSGDSLRFMFAALSLPPPAALAALTQRVRAEALEDHAAKLEAEGRSIPLGRRRADLLNLAAELRASVASPKRDEP